jgi:dolichyldiphosphatase
MWFFTTYIIYFIFIRLHHINSDSILSRVWIAGALGGVVGGAIAVSIARVYLMYHSVRQVAVGGVVGAIWASLWFALTHCVLTPLFPQIVSWKISELLLLRDTTLIPNVLWFEYTSSRQEARARSRKLVPTKAQ